MGHGKRVPRPLFFAQRVIPTTRIISHISANRHVPRGVSPPFFSFFFFRPPSPGMVDHPAVTDISYFFISNSQLEEVG